MDTKEKSGESTMNQKIKTVEFHDDRWYRVGDEYYPSVTTILGIISRPFLAKWRGDIGNREADMRMFEASERGTRIHSAFETLIKGGTVVYNPPQRPVYTPDEINALTAKYDGFVEIVKYQDEALQINKLMKFLEIVKPEILASEVTVYSDSQRYAGTVDAVMKIKGGKYPVNGRVPLEIKGGVWIVDLKTGKSLDDNAFMQMAAYAGAHVELGGAEVAGTMVLHTGSSNRAGIEGLGVSVRTDEMDQDFRDFQTAHQLWLRKNKNVQPKAFEFPTLFTLKKEK